MDVFPPDRIDALLPQTEGSGRPLATALIAESECIGCTLCIQACPFDAIVGAHQRMHTVIEPLCTGCERCLDPCPVDCISMVVATPARVWTRAQAEAARTRYRARRQRLQRDGAPGPSGAQGDWIADTVARAVARARQRRSRVVAMLRTVDKQ